MRIFPFPKRPRGENGEREKSGVRLFSPLAPAVVFGVGAALWWWTQWARGSAESETQASASGESDSSGESDKPGAAGTQAGQGDAVAQIVSAPVAEGLDESVSVQAAVDPQAPALGAAAAHDTPKPPS